MSVHHSSPEEVAERYGRTRRARSVPVWVWIAAAVAFTVASVLVIVPLSDPPVNAELSRWEVAEDTSPLQVTISIDRDPNLALTCDLVAVDDRFVIVGQRQVEIPAGPETRFYYETEIPLERAAVAPEIGRAHV